MEIMESNVRAEPEFRSPASLRTHSPSSVLVMDFPGFGTGRYAVSRQIPALRFHTVVRLFGRAVLVRGKQSKPFFTGQAAGAPLCKRSSVKKESGGT